MKITVCNLHDERPAFEHEWSRLVQYVQAVRSDLVVLPEMPFCRWFAGSDAFDSAAWRSAVRAHDVWEPRLRELAPAVVAASRPVDFGNVRYNEGFVWDTEHGCRAVHIKTLLPDRTGDREGSWYSSAPEDFAPLDLGTATIGFLFGAELAALQEAQRYRDEGVDLIVSPRVGGRDAPDGSFESARLACMRAQAYLATSSRIDDAGAFAGQAWIIGPRGNVLAMTNEQRAFASAEIDPHAH